MDSLKLPGIEGRQRTSVSFKSTYSEWQLGLEADSHTHSLVLGWPKSLLHFFFHKIRDIFFIFTNDFFDLVILSMLSISCYWFLVARGQGCC